jgi:hypothetical protein
LKTKRGTADDVSVIPSPKRCKREKMWYFVCLFLTKKVLCCLFFN